MVKRIAKDSKNNYYLVETDVTDSNIQAILAKLGANDISTDMSSLTLIDGAPGSFNYGEFIGDVTGEITFEDARIDDDSTLYKTIDISPFSMNASATLTTIGVSDSDEDTDTVFTYPGIYVYCYEDEDTTAMMMGQISVPVDWRKGTDIEIYGVFSKSSSSTDEAGIVFEHIILDPSGGTIPNDSIIDDSVTTAEDTKLEIILLSTILTDDIQLGHLIYYSIARNSSDAYSGSLYFHGLKIVYQVDVIGIDGKFTKSNGSEIED